jgi:hypothetical protein
MNTREWLENERLSNLLGSVVRALDERGVAFGVLKKQARAIALFGSRAGGCERASSDWDLLCIGDGRSRKRDGLDLVWVSAEDVESGAWLGSDLAGHVAAHGIWLHGEPSFRLGDVRFASAARRKEERLACDVRGVGRVWDLLGAPYQRKHATLLRRDVQRLRSLERGVPVPPSAWLDARWRAEPASSGELRDALLLLGASAALCSALVSRAG